MKRPRKPLAPWDMFKSGSSSSVEVFLCFRVVKAEPASWSTVLVDSNETKITLQVEYLQKMPRKLEKITDGFLFHLWMKLLNLLLVLSNWKLDTIALSVYCVVLFARRCVFVIKGGSTWGAIPIGLREYARGESSMINLMYDFRGIGEKSIVLFVLPTTIWV